MILGTVGIIDTDSLGGPGCHSWMAIADSEAELREFYDKCRFKVGWTRWQRFKMWLFRKYPKVTGYKEVFCNELDNV